MGSKETGYDYFLCKKEDVVLYRAQYRVHTARWPRTHKSVGIVPGYSGPTVPIFFLFSFFRSKKRSTTK